MTGQGENWLVHGAEETASRRWSMRKSAREILRPAGESAGLQDDVLELFDLFLISKKRHPDNSIGSR